MRTTTAKTTEENHKLLGSLAERQIATEKIVGVVAQNQADLIEQTQGLMKCLKILIEQTKPAGVQVNPDGSIDYREKRWEGGEEKGNTKPVRGGQIGPLGAGS